MYKLLIVDDEHLELELLEKHVPWNILGFEICATAKNGLDALEKVKELCPDIIITDVKMPIMDGIEFSKQVHTSFPEIKIVFLSGYNQFGYLKSALQVEAIDYLLKPIDMDELNQLMFHIKAKCDSERKSSPNKIITLENVAEMIASKDIKDWHKNAYKIMTLCNKYLGVNLDDDMFEFALVTIEEYEYLLVHDSYGISYTVTLRKWIHDFASQLHAMVLQVENDKFLLIAKDKLSDLNCEEIETIEAESRKYINICYLDKSIHMDRFPQMYQQLGKLQSDLVKRFGAGHVLSTNEIIEKLTVEDTLTYDPVEKFESKKVILAIQKLDMKEATSLLHRFYASYVGSGMIELVYIKTLEMLDRLYDNIIDANKMLEAQIDDKTTFCKPILKVKSPFILDSIMTQFIQKIINNLELMNQEPGQLKILQIKDYIDHNFNNPLTIDSLGEKFFYSPTYLRSVFKKYIGKTVHDYITDLRIEYSLQLLCQTTLKVNEISSKIGYSNPSYYCSVFTSRYGVTPNQYRSRYSA